VILRRQGRRIIQWQLFGGWCGRGRTGGSHGLDCWNRRALAVTEDGVTDEKEDVEVGWDDASVLGMAVAVSAGVVVG
jgi:hypothetical protein